MKFWQFVMNPANNDDGMNFADQPHVIFELTNEHDSQKSKDDWQEICDIVRGRAADSIMIVGSLAGSEKDGFRPEDLSQLDVDWIHFTHPAAVDG